MKLSGNWTGYGAAVAATAAGTLAGWVISPRFDVVNVAMVYLLAVVFVAYRFARGPAVLTSIASVAAFDVLFVPPRGTFSVHDLQYLLTFAIMLVVGLLISGLMDRVRRQAAERATLEITSETERIRSALLASISHDLRTPLAVMAGASSALAASGERMSAEERSALARSVFEQARDMSDHVASVLQMARLETGAIELERDWVALPEIVASVLDRLRERLAAHRVLLDLPGDLPLVRGNAALIEQALTNLLENAARHTPAGTVVRVRARQEDGQIVVSVEDFGPGLPDGDLEQLFAKFQHGARELSGGGTGLGLAICRAIVRLHGGRVWAERVPGGGAALRFTLPLLETPPVPREADA